MVFSRRAPLEVTIRALKGFLERAPFRVCSRAPLRVTFRVLIEFPP